MKRKFDSQPADHYNSIVKPKLRGKTKAQVSDLAALLKPYSSGWVALSPDEKQVIGAAATLHEVHRQATRQGYPHPVFVKVLPPNRGEEYETLLQLKRNREFQQTPAQKKALARAQGNLKMHRTRSLNQFGKALGLTV